MKQFRLLRTTCVFAIYLIFHNQLALAQLSKPVIGSVKIAIEWTGVSKNAIGENEFLYFFQGKNIQLDGLERKTPYYVSPTNLLSPTLTYSIEDLTWKSVPDSERVALPNENLLEKEAKFLQGIEQHRPIQQIRMPLIRRQGNQWQKLISFQLVPGNNKIQAVNRLTSQTYFPAQSVLANGTWLKIAVQNTGLHRIDAALLKSMGLNLAQLDPRTLRLYGGQVGMLPKSNAKDRVSDLVEIPLYILGEADGRFDNDDQAVFFATGPNTWEWDADRHAFSHQINLYDNNHYYFLTYGGSQGLRIENQNAVNGGSLSPIRSFDDYAFIENELRNNLKSGSQWLGEDFDLTLNRSFPFSFPNIASGSSVKLRVSVQASCLSCVSQFSLSVDNQPLDIIPITGIIPNAYPLSGNEAIRDYTFNPGSGSFNVQLSYNKPNSSAVGWLDFLEVQLRRPLDYTGVPLYFRDTSSTLNSISTYSLLGFPSDVQVWSLRNRLQPKRMLGNFVGNSYLFSDSSAQLTEYIAFSGSNIGNLPKPIFISTVANQNLHAIQQADLIIVTHPEFFGAAQNLASLHRDKEGYTTSVITTDQIYNEFSSGKQDITAIREFVRMLYMRNAGNSLGLPKYLTLFGRASYDPKNRVRNNTNFVPTFQSPNSTNPFSSYCSDAYFSLLDDSEGEFAENSGEYLDIGVGRLPVVNQSDADALVEKVRQYYSSNNQGDWKNMALMVSDDGDQNTHLYQSETFCNLIRLQYPLINFEKVNLDAYNLVSLPGGSRYPDVNVAINARMMAGCLLVNYVGHGGVNGWADERVLTIPDIENWSQNQRLPVFVTATCEFSRYDEAERLSAGELVLLNPKGGSISMLTTSRVTFSGDNFSLTSFMFNNVFFQRDAQGKALCFGDIYKKTLNQSISTVNTRNFTLLGDPAIRLALPEQKTQVNWLNNVQITPYGDTLKALAKVEFKGTVFDKNGVLLQNFNGTVYPTIFDKKTLVPTLGNNPSSIKTNFVDQSSILFKGKASVQNGNFKFSFIVPKDIAYNYDFGRVSLYAHGMNGSQNLDAAGYYDSIMIGGAYAQAPADKIGPDIRLFMNSENFVSGGLVNKDPVLIAQLRDSSGINTLGNGIGHDIMAVINENTLEPLNLNRFYQAKTDDFREGTVRYNFSNLNAGRYSLRLKVWDVYNNSSESRIEFVIADQNTFSVQNLLNYPNPFTTHTTFHFDHNRPGELLKARIQIYSVSGSLVKVIEKDINSSGTHNQEIEWDGLDQYGDRIGRGTYFYILSLTTPQGEQIQSRQKLVILK